MIRIFFRYLAIVLLTLLPEVQRAFSQPWEAVPLVTAESAKSGIKGGEGCQWPQAIAVEPQNGRRLLFGTDVGGIYRSEDGGSTWQPSNTGLDARGACAFAFDPENPDRALLVAGNSLEQPFHGIYLSTDGGISWKNTQPYGNLGYRDFREQIAFDRASIDKEKKITLVAYWSAAKTKTRGPGFFKTMDGGNSWQELPQVGDKLGECIVKTHPIKGWIYAGGPNGLFLSKDAGNTFSKIFDQSITGLDITPKKPDDVYLSTAKEIFISENSGESFQVISSAKFPPDIGRTGVARLCVSPADPQRMLIENDEGDWNRTRYLTWDKGKTWEPVQYDVKNSFIPKNDRQMVAAWHPTDPNIVWSIGGDFITRSLDGGKTFTWSNSGYTGLMVGHSFQFNATNPNLVFVPSQDYDGSISPDAGKTWKYAGVSGEGWGGYTYGGYGFNMDYIVGGSRGSWGGKTELRINDHGNVIKTGTELQGIPIGTGDPSNENIAFLHNHRTTDGGKTWHKMTNCDGVLTYDPSNTTLLYGALGDTVLISEDHGVTWKNVCKLPRSIVRDIAVDPQSGILYIASDDDSLYVWSFKSETLDTITDRLPSDQFGNKGVQSVATDPAKPSVVYAVRAGNLYQKDTAVSRSTDSGKTWISLNRSARLGIGLEGPDGGREAMWVRVHPVNRYAYTASNCFGLWRFPPPN